ncbi:MAG: glucokinase [Bacteroidetes bacterium]|nr:MAG: glucokinase [Bacteroidota bacterium]
MSLTKIPLSLPGKSKLKKKTINVLAGDIGGTKTNLALFKADVNGIEQVTESSFQSSKFSSFEDMLKEFLAAHDNIKLDRICLGVAGPVFQGKVELTNLSWYIDASALAKLAKTKSVTLINDLEATAFGLAGLSENDIIMIHPGAAEQGGNLAILAPGTGLGEGGLYWDGKSYFPFPTEGGHSDYSPRTEFDLELYSFLQKRYEVVSWEKVIAGPGIRDIYDFLCEVKKRPRQEWLMRAFENQDPSAVISESGLAESDPTCSEAMQNYVRYLARESSNLVLKLKATGGLFLGGGIPPKITSLLQQNVFYDNFLDCDRMQDLIRKVPVAILLNDKTALIGAGYYGSYGITK